MFSTLCSWILTEIYLSSPPQRTPPRRPLQCFVWVPRYVYRCSIGLHGTHQIQIYIGLDPHQDSSIDLLHTVLLGLDKYVWHKTSSAWNEKKGKLFSIRLNLASSLDGLSGSREDGEYIVKYKNNLIGRQLKFIQQLAIFHLHQDMCNSLVFDLWKATGELGALLWYPVINDMEQYLVSQRWHVVCPQL